METLNFPRNNETAAQAAASMAQHVGTSATHVLDATKAAGQNVGAVAQEEMTSLRADLDQLISRLSSLSELELVAAKEKLLAKIESTKLAAQDVTAGVSQQFNRGVGVTTDYVKERPLQSVAVAAGIGVMLGMLITRR